MKRKTLTSILGSTYFKLALYAVALLVGVLLPMPEQALANYCPGEDGSCHGYYPTAYGCSVSSTTSVYRDGGDAYVSVRNSSNCNAEWARVTNVSGGSRYVAASIRYGGSNYDYHFSEDSGDPHAPIGDNELIWTAAVWPDDTIPVRACGNTSTSPLSLPVSVSDYYCGYVN